MRPSYLLNNNDGIWNFNWSVLFIEAYVWTLTFNIPSFKVKYIFQLSPGVGL